MKLLQILVVTLLVCATTIVVLFGFFVNQTVLLVTFIVLIQLITLFVLHRFYNLLNLIDPTVLFIIGYVIFISSSILFTSYYGISLAPPVLLAIHIGLISFALGAITLELFSFRSGLVNDYKSIEITSTYQLSTHWAWVLFGTGILVLLYYYNSVGTIPLLAKDAENARVTLKSGRGYLPIAAFALLNVSTTMLLAISLKGNNSRQIRVAIFALIVATLILLGVGYRSFVIKLILNGIIVYSYLRNFNISKLKLFALALVVFIILSLIGFYRISGGIVRSWTEFEFTISQAIWSLFVRYAVTLQLVMSFFQNGQPFMFGESYLLTLDTVRPGNQLHFGFWLRDRLGLSLRSEGPVDPTIVGEFYANFGWPGIFTGMYIMGFGLRAVYRFLTRNMRISLLRFVVLVVLSTSIMDIIGSGIPLVLLFSVLPLSIVIIIYGLLINISKHLRSLLRYQNNRFFTDKYRSS